MTKSIFKHCNIHLISTVIPERKISIDDEARFYDGDIRKIERLKSVTGFNTRHVVDVGTTSVDLCYSAAQRIFDEEYMAKDNIDALIFVTQNPDYLLPANACVLHGKLNLKKSCPAFDINQGCAGYIYGLWVACSLIESGAAKRILLCAGDTCSTKCDERNRNTAPVFGDAGTATIVEYDEKETLFYFDLECDGTGYDNIIIPAGGARIPINKSQDIKSITEDINNNQAISHLTDIYMNGMNVFDFTMTVVPNHIKQVMKDANIKSEELDYLILHQANKQIMKMISKSVGVPIEKVPTETFSKYGNQTIASIPSVLCDTLAGDIKDKRLVLSGFGVGLSWGTCALNINKTKCLPVKYYHSANEAGIKDNIIKWKAKLGGENEEK